MFDLEDFFEDVFEEIRYFIDSIVYEIEMFIYSALYMFLTFLNLLFTEGYTSAFNFLKHDRHTLYEYSSFTLAMIIISYILFVYFRFGIKKLTMKETSKYETRIIVCISFIIVYFIIRHLSGLISGDTYALIFFSLFIVLFVLGGIFSVAGSFIGEIPFLGAGGELKLGCFVSILIIIVLTLIVFNILSTS